MSKVFLFYLSLIFILNSGCTKPSHAQKIRQPAVAGAFYPADSSALRKMAQGFLSRAKAPRVSEPLIAAVSPHAGYIYSGPVAAETYAQLRGRAIKRVVIIAPSHYDYFQGACIYNGDAYATPLGTVAIDKKFARNLAARNARIFLGARGHIPISPNRGEHSIEVELPFLQTVLKRFTLVPVIMGEQSYQTCRALGKALARLITDRQTLILASSDLSHYHTYRQAVSLDGKVLNAIREWDYYNLSRNLQGRIWEACGGGPIVATMIAAEALGADTAKLLLYANSGDRPNGDRSRVVGYSAFVFFKSKHAAPQKSFRLNKNDRRTLLKIARKAVEEKVRNGQTFLPQVTSPALLQARGAFVTLTEDGRLRGCIGYTAPIKALYLTVRDVAIDAATEDPRFKGVKANELSHLNYEISVLSPFRHVRKISRIEVGKDGLLIKKDGYTGLLLPQVPQEFGWDRKTFLEQTCRKAGLPENAWQKPDADIFKFTAFVFSK